MEKSEIDAIWWRRITIWVMSVTIVILAGLAFQIEIRNDAIHNLQVASNELLETARHTDEVVDGIVAAQNSPESRERARRVEQALNEIQEIHIEIDQVIDILCSLEGNPGRDAACGNLTGD